MIAAAFIHIAPDPIAAVLRGGKILGFHPVANDRVAACSDCGLQAGDQRALRCREGGCSLRHAGTMSAERFCHSGE